MKPKEFDDLIRQKFDQNDFAYSPRNWDQLAEQMDGRAKKRSILMWWVMPLAGVAASVALAMGVAPIMKQGVPGQPGIGAGMAHVQQVQGSNPAISNNDVAAPAAAIYEHAAAKHQHKSGAAPAKEEEYESGEDVRISLANAIPNNTGKHKADINLLKKEETVTKKEPKKEADKAEVAGTFKPEAEQKTPRTSIILNGGYSRGTQNSGYMAGITVRRMVTEHVYIESDVAFVGSGNTQTGYQYNAAPTGSSGAGNGNPVLPSQTTTTAGGRTTGGDVNPLPPNPYGTVTAKDVTYNLYYAQVSPSVGCKITNRISVGAGPDFQQVVGGSTPNLDPSGVYKDNIARTPTLDIGLTGKTEYALTKKVKAGVYYRKGINNALSGGEGKYIDRDYLQFQLRCAIFNR